MNFLNVHPTSRTVLGHTHSPSQPCRCLHVYSQKRSHLERGRPSIGGLSCGRNGKDSVVIHEGLDNLSLNPAKRAMEVDDSSSD